MPYPDRFYPVVDSVAWVARLARLGVGTIQLRAKELNESEALQIVTDALEVIKGTDARLVVNDYWRAAIVAGAKHLHLGQEDLVDADLSEIRKAGLTLGISTHDDEELATALAAKPDYIALGPIFPTTLKSMRFAPQGIPRITEWKSRSAASSSNSPPRSSPPARTRSPSSATSRRTPTRMQGCGSGWARRRRSRDVHCSKPCAIHSAVIARLDRAIQYAAAPRSHRAASGILDPRFRGDDSCGRFSHRMTAVAVSRSAMPTN
jgi:thiamine-phosphate pyrophosphorylase